MVSSKILSDHARIVFARQIWSGFLQVQFTFFLICTIFQFASSCFFIRNCQYFVYMASYNITFCFVDLTIFQKLCLSFFFLDQVKWTFYPINQPNAPFISFKTKIMVKINPASSSAYAVFRCDNPILKTMSQKLVSLESSTYSY